MDLEQLLDPTRLATIWSQPSRREADTCDRAAGWASPPADSPGPGEERTDSRGAAATGDEPAAPPDARACFLALQEEVARLFAENSEPRLIVDALLEPMRQALAGESEDDPGPGALPTLEELDDLEDVLDAWLAAGAGSTAAARKK